MGCALKQEGKGGEGPGFFSNWRPPLTKYVSRHCLFMVVICLNMDEDRSSILKRVFERLYAYSVLDILEMTYLGPVSTHKE